MHKSKSQLVVTNTKAHIQLSHYLFIFSTLPIPLCLFIFLYLDCSSKETIFKWLKIQVKHHDEHNKRMKIIIIRYRLRSKVDIEHMGDEFYCWQRYGGNVSEKSSSVEEPEVAGVGYGGSVDSASMSSSQGTEGGWQWFKDPRLECLGFRGIFPSESTPPLVEADKEEAEEIYLLWRLEKGVAEGPNEIPKGEAIPLEYNLAGLNAISFDTGCYVGQELVARTHHRGVIRKRVLPLKFVDNNGKEVEQKVAPGSEVVDTSSGKKIGTVTTALGSRGLGLLKLQEALKGPGALSIQGSEDVKIVADRPKWWPAEWVSE